MYAYIHGERTVSVGVYFCYVETAAPFACTSYDDVFPKASYIYS